MQKSSNLTKWRSRLEIFFGILHFCLKIIGKSRDSSSVMFDVIYFFEAKITTPILCVISLDFLTSIFGITRPSLAWLTHGGLIDDTTWWHRSGSTLAQVMVCCLNAPSHCLNQYWLVRNVMSPTSNFKEMLINLIHMCSITHLKLLPLLPQSNEFLTLFNKSIALTGYCIMTYSQITYLIYVTCILANIFRLV